MRKLLMALPQILTFAVNFVVSLFFGSSWMSVSTASQKNKLPRRKKFNFLQKRIFDSVLIVVSIALCSACSSSESDDRRNTRFAEYRNRVDVRYVKPSESMQAGVPKDRLEQEMYNHYFEREKEMDHYSEYFKIDNPHEISGVSYFPQNYVEFEEVGVASWYGADFHGKYTANGEIYDAGAMTAAHPTLPLPSTLRVTNLRNGRVVIVRVNDRGPYSKERILDVSEKAAEELGFKDQGTTKVYIQLLRNDTDEMLNKLKIKN